MRKNKIALLVPLLSLTSCGGGMSFEAFKKEADAISAAPSKYCFAYAHVNKGKGFAIGVYSEEKQAYTPYKIGDTIETQTKGETNSYKIVEPSDGNSGTFSEYPGEKEAFSYLSFDVKTFYYLSINYLYDIMRDAQTLGLKVSKLASDPSGNTFSVENGVFTVNYKDDLPREGCWKFNSKGLCTYASWKSMTLQYETYFAYSDGPIKTHDGYRNDILIPQAD